MAFARTARRCAQQLHAAWIGEPAAQQPVAVFLHGLLGNGRNVQTLARKYCQQQPGRAGLLVDLRGHGKSAVATEGAPGPHTIKNCAADVALTLRTGVGAAPTAIPGAVTLVGHSLGGRVALQYAYDALAPPVDRLWLLDTVPGSAFASVAFTLEIATSFLEDPPVATRKEAEAILKRDYFVDPATAQWLAGSYLPEAHRFEFDLRVAQDLLANFAEQDFLHQLDTVLRRGDVRVDLVRAGLNRSWSDDDVRYLQEQRSERFGFHTLANAGHWVHIDALPELLEVMET